jgi:hypothetical protein
MMDTVPVQTTINGADETPNGADETPPGVDVARVLAVADGTKRLLRRRTSAILNIRAKDAAEETARVAVTILRELDAEMVRRAALAFLVGLSADDGRFRRAAEIGVSKKKQTSPGGRQNLRATMPASTRFVGESFPISCPQARYQEHMARQRAEQAKKEARGDA